MKTQVRDKFREQLQALSQDELMERISSAPIPVRDHLRIGGVCMGMGILYLVIDLVGASMSPGSSCAHATPVYVCMGIILMTTFTQLYSTNARLSALTELVKRQKNELEARNAGPMSPG
ncbi:MAG: hypothetical protein K2W95_32865 [Candidatus Obscuribacterales bacterium]|nr:hypothetical protein [Candidatus Obscuribacterales bacterium]